MSNDVSGSGRTAFYGQNKAKFVNNCEKVLTIEHLKKVNLDRVQGKQDDQVFFSKQITYNIVKNTNFLLRFYNYKVVTILKCESNFYKYLNKVRNESKERVGWKGKKSTNPKVGVSLNTVGDEFLRHKQIELILRRQGVHPNPGPGQIRGSTEGGLKVRPDVVFMTYNC